MTFQKGDKASIYFYSDTQPCTVIRRTLTTVTVRFDKAVRDPNWKPEHVPGGFAGHVINNNSQRWIISDDPDGTQMVFSLRKNGHWIRRGETEKGARLTLGWHRFYDYNF